MCEFTNLTELYAVLDSDYKSCPTFTMEIEYTCESQREWHNQETKKCRKHCSREHFRHRHDDQSSSCRCSRPSRKNSEPRQRPSAKSMPRISSADLCKRVGHHIESRCRQARDSIDLIRDWTERVNCSSSTHSRNRAGTKWHRKSKDWSSSYLHCPHEVHIGYGNQSAQTCSGQMWNTSNNCGHEGTDECHTWYRRQESHDEICSDTNEQPEAPQEIYDYSESESKWKNDSKVAFYSEWTPLPDYECHDEASITHGRRTRKTIPDKNAVFAVWHTDMGNTVQRTCTHKLENSFSIKSILKDRTGGTKFNRSVIPKRKSVTFNRVSTMITFRKNQRKLDRRREFTILTFNGHILSSSSC